MKYLFFITCAFLVKNVFAQDFGNIDSILAAPQNIELSISTPQPRLNETFQISIDINHLRANIFKSLAGKVEPASNITVQDSKMLSINVTATSKGKNEIGPLQFNLDKTKYTTNKLSYEVIDPLPATDEGLWFRKVVTGDNSFCIIIEQRIPSAAKRVENDNILTFTSEPAYSDVAKFKDSYSIKGLSGLNSNAYTNFGSVEINGARKAFMYAFSVYYFTILDKSLPIKITKDRFEHLPSYFYFKDIVVQ